jgi:hypothetical protein
LPEDHHKVHEERRDLGQDHVHAEDFEGVGHQFSLFLGSWLSFINVFKDDACKQGYMPKN